MLTDIEIAQQNVMDPIEAVAERVGLTRHDLAFYGKYKAKISFDAISRMSDKENGKLVLVTAINPNLSSFILSLSSINPSENTTTT